MSDSLNWLLGSADELGLDLCFDDEAAARNLDDLVPLATPARQLSRIISEGDAVDAFLNSRDDADLEWDEVAAEMGCPLTPRSNDAEAQQVVPSDPAGRTCSAQIRPAPVLVRLSRPVLIEGGPSSAAAFVEAQRAPLRSAPSGLSPEARLKHKGWAEKRKARVKYGRKHMYANKRAAAKSRRRANGKFETREMAEARARAAFARIRSPVVI